MWSVNFSIPALSSATDKTFISKSHQPSQTNLSDSLWEVDDCIGDPATSPPSETASWPGCVSPWIKFKLCPSESECGIAPLAASDAIHPKMGLDEKEPALMCVSWQTEMPEGSELTYDSTQTQSLWAFFCISTHCWLRFAFIFRKVTLFLKSTVPRR